MVLIHILLMLLLLFTPAHVVAQQSSPPVPPQPPARTLAIFPAHLANRADRYAETVTAALHSAVNEERSVRLVFSSLRNDPGAVQSAIDSSKQGIWHRQGIFSKTKPNVDVITAIANKAGIDAVLLSAVEVIFYGKDYIEIYLVDVRNKKLYVAEGETKDFSRGEGFDTIHSLAKQVLAEYRKEQPPGDYLVAEKPPQPPQDTATAKADARITRQQEEERRRQDEAARLAAKQQEKERQQRDEAQRVAEQRRQDEAARLAAQQLQEDERKRQGEAARLAAQQQEKERQQRDEAQRVAEQRRQDEAARLAAQQLQEDERKRQGEAARLAAQQREEAARLAAQKQAEERPRKEPAPGDRTSPNIVLTSHEITRSNKVATITSRAWVIGKVQDESGVAEVTVNGGVAMLDQEGNFSKEILLRVGQNAVNVTAVDVHANAVDVQFVIERETGMVQRTPAEQPPTQKTDVIAPTLAVTSHNISKPVVVSATTSKVVIGGKASDHSGVAEVTINEEAALLDPQGNFSKEILLHIGKNRVLIKAVDVYANVAEVQLAIDRAAGDVAAVHERKYTELLKTMKVGKYYAMVIGNNNYRYLPKLLTPVKDANEVGTLLKQKYGFETEILIDATRADILSTLGRMGRKMKPEDSFLIYYAGHGVFETVSQEAYWLPVEARQDDLTEWIIASSITAEIKRNPSRHILVVADSCYSGTLTRNVKVELEAERNREYFLKKMLEKSSRTLMASGGNEPVIDDGADGHSIFAYIFLRALREIEDGAFTAEELFHKHVKQSIAGNAEQTPEYHIIRNSGHDGGDFVFIKR